MGQSLSRRPPPPPPPPPTLASAPAAEHVNDTHPPRRSLPRRIFSSLPKPSLRSRPLSSSLGLPTRPEQTLRGKRRRWGLSRRHNVPAGIEGSIPEHIHSSAEHDEHQVDRDVDEFGVITHRVPDSHNDTQAPLQKGKEKAKDVCDAEVDNEDDNSAASSSAASLPTQSGARTDHIDDDQVVPPSPRQPPLLPTTQESERPFVPPSSLSTAPTLLHSSAQSTNTTPRSFPPPGTLVVVQGVVHTTDAPRSSERPATTSNPTPPTANDPINSNINPGFETDSTRPSSLPPGTRSHNPLSNILPRPTSMVPPMLSSPPSESMADTPIIDSQTQQATFSPGGTAEDTDDEGRTLAHAHGVSMPQGPIGASSLSASSIDVLGTLLSVAAAATAASLLTGSSEPIFSSGLTSPRPPSSGSTPQPTGFSSNVPSERPLSPTPTSDAGRMRHVWSSLRDRLGLGSGAHSSTHPNDTTFGLGPGQSVSSQPSDIVRSHDPREIMLAEMARAFNLGLGLGGASTNGAASSTASAVVSPNSYASEGPTPDADDGLARDRDREQTLIPPPDSFERFLMDLQSDLRVTLTQEQVSGVLRRAPQDMDENAEALGEEVQHIPELQSLSDFGSEEFETRFNSEDEDNDDDVDDVHTARGQFSGRVSPAVSPLSADIHSIGSTSPFHTSGMSPCTAPSQSMSTAVSSGAEAEVGADNDKGDDIPSARASEMRSEEEPEGQREAVLGVVHSPGASNVGRRAEAEGRHAISGTIAMPPHDTQDPSNVPGTDTRRGTFLPGTSPLSVPLTSNPPYSLPGRAESTTPSPRRPPALPLSSDPESTSQGPSSIDPTPADSSMPFHLPFTSSSASRTERTPGGGINWWRMYRFPAVASPNQGQPGGFQGPLPLSHPPLHTPAQGPSHASASWPRTTHRNQQNEIILPPVVAEVPGAHSGLAGPVPLSPSATPTNMPGPVSAPSSSASTSLPGNGLVLDPPTNTGINYPEHRSNVVVPVIVVGLQSVNTDRQPPHMPHPHTNPTTATDDEDGEGMDSDGLEQPMSMPLNIPEPAEFRRHSSSSNTTQQEQGGQQPARGRTWQSRAANAIRNLRSSRRNADATSPQPPETPGSRTFLIYVIGGYYPPDHQIITGGNLDSFEALWELAELLGQVKPPTVSKEDIERSGLEIIKASMLPEYEKETRVASNCIDRCLICLDDYNPEDELRVLTCKHAFHQGCVDRWLETGRNNCPACRTKGVANQDA